MPALGRGARLGLRRRACPVVRLASAVEVPGKKGEPVKYRAGAEIDAWVYQNWFAKDRPGGSREQVYGLWLERRLAGAAELESVRVEAFNRQQLVRRSHGEPRRAQILERPQVLLRGVLRVSEAAPFHRLLAQGVGRHRAYGFGMLLLHPPPRC